MFVRRPRPRSRPCPRVRAHGDGKTITVGQLLGQMGALLPKGGASGGRCSAWISCMAIHNDPPVDPLRLAGGAGGSRGKMKQQKKTRQQPPPLPPPVATTTTGASRALSRSRLSPHHHRRALPFGLQPRLPGQRTGGAGRWWQPGPAFQPRFAAPHRRL